MRSSAFLSAAFLASLATATPYKRSAASNAGATTQVHFHFSETDLYPAPNATLNTALFPNESQLGYPGPTLTGVEPNAAKTAAAFPSHTYIYPLVVPAPYQTGSSNPDATNITGTYGAPGKPSSSSSSSGFLSARYWGNLSPQYSVDSAVYGLAGASPSMPEGCNAVQVIYYYRHGARYPTTGSSPSAFATKINNLTSHGGFNAVGPLSFLNTWTYKIGAELLTPFGRQQNFDLGVGARVAYGNLLNNFTAQGTVPVLRTQSQDRMVKTALNFAAGFFGIPTEGQYELSIGTETPGLNETGAPYEICNNSNNARGSVGSTASTAYIAQAFLPAATRLNSFITGVNFTVSDVSAMLSLCAYETDALGYSKFCELFTQEDFEAFEYSFDLSFYGNNGMGSPVAAAQGLGYVQELVSRLTHTPLTNCNTTTNCTLDQNPTTFPLNSSLYFDAAHEVSILDAMTALNLTLGTPPPANGTSSTGHFVASQVVPFATVLVGQVLECQASVPTKQMRFIVNDAVVPLSYPGCKPDFNGLCAYDTVVAGLKARMAEIDFNYDCFANYTVPAYGTVKDGRAPK